MRAPFFGMPVPTNDDADRTALAELEQAMNQAAAQAVKLGLGIDVFMGAAHAAYLNANPALREHLESVHLLAQLGELRRRGLVGDA
jgi:hypothetical protein